jgi:hypothetical protein
MYFNSYGKLIKEYTRGNCGRPFDWRRGRVFTSCDCLTRLGEIEGINQIHCNNVSDRENPASCAGELRLR